MNLNPPIKISLNLKVYFFVYALLFRIPMMVMYMDIYRILPIVCVGIFCVGKWGHWREKWDSRRRKWDYLKAKWIGCLQTKWVMGGW